jgi:hypothetical protein
VIANNKQNQIKSNHNKKYEQLQQRQEQEREELLIRVEGRWGKNLRERINREGEGKPNQPQQQQIRGKKQQQQSNKKQIGMKKIKERRGRRIRRCG